MLGFSEQTNSTTKKPHEVISKLLVLPKSGSEYKEQRKKKKERREKETVHILELTHIFKCGINLRSGN